jgi:anthranilate/para-aminobenzoate synthase component I
LNIAIRTVIITAKMLSSAGGGIVADSTEAEWDETMPRQGTSCRDRRRAET